MGTSAQGKGQTEVTSMADSASGGPSAHRLLALAGILTPAYVRLPSTHHTSPARKTPNADTAEDWGAAPGSLRPHTVGRDASRCLREAGGIGREGKKSRSRRKRKRESGQRDKERWRWGAVEKTRKTMQEVPACQSSRPGPGPWHPSSAWPLQHTKGRGNGDTERRPSCWNREPARVPVPSVGGIPG